jgi:hypothetical protein
MIVLSFASTRLQSDWYQLNACCCHCQDAALSSIFDFSNIYRWPKITPENAVLVTRLRAKCHRERKGREASLQSEPSALPVAHTGFPNIPEAYSVIPK